MDSRFEVEAHVDFKGVYALQKASKSVAFRAFLWVCSAVCALGAVLLWVLNQPGKWRVTACALLVLSFALCVDRLVAWLVYGARNRKVGAIRYSFDDEGMHLANAVEAGVVYYNGFVKLLESEAYYFLFVQKHAAHVLPKSDFTRGEPAELAGFLEEKTGKSVIRVRG